MASTPKPSRVSYIILRYMRRPIMVLIVVYAVSMAGWILIPGVDAEGEPQTLSFFHAFYFLTYTVTTTGFGELPQPFTEAQRMWGIVSLYTGVIAWFYALGSIVGLVQNPDFQQSVAERRFAKRVARLSAPFCIVCGFGNTGALLTRGLSDAGMTVIVVDIDPERIKTVTLRDYRAEVWGIVADARVPEQLLEAGLQKPNCRAVVALTKNERINLKVAVTTHLLNPSVTVVTESTSEVYEDTLATLGDEVHIVDPFQTFARYLGATLSNPAVHTLNQWLAGTPNATLDDTLRPPTGIWIVCGFGRMGRRLCDALEVQGIATVVIEPNPGEHGRDVPRLIVGRATQANLLEAGAVDAAGIVACTDTDSDNLSILLNARALNPDIFCVVRQNRYRNQVVFRAARADFIMMPSMVAARRILFQLIAPLLKPLFEALRAEDARAAATPIGDLIERLRTTIGGSQPRVWTLGVTGSACGALLRVIRAGRSVTFDHLLRDPTDRGSHLACVPLVLQSIDASPQVMPSLSTPVQPEDQILFCGSPRAQRLLEATIDNEYTLGYLMTGQDEPRGWVMQWLRHKIDASPQQVGRRESADLSKG